MNFDVIVLGTGGVGSGAIYHLARGEARVLGLDRFAAGHDRGSSHGRTRIMRQAYYEHPDYVPLTLRAYELWADLEQRRGEQLFHEIGLLQIGPAEGAVLRGVQESAQRHGLDVEEFSAEAIALHWPGFRIPGETAKMVGLFERRAGYLRVEACVEAHLEEAAKLGATLRGHEPVVSWQAEGSGVVVRTEQNVYSADRLVITAGAWSATLLAELGLRLEVRRKPQYWYAIDDNALRTDSGCPAFLYETPSGIFYGIPQIDEEGLKVACHSGGKIVADPTNLDADIDTEDRQSVENFLAGHLPGVSRKLLDHRPCMYTMTPDEHFIVDRHPQFPQVAFAAGMSGHGFKFTGVLGQALADLTLAEKTDLPIGFLNCRRPGLCAS